MIKTYEGIIVKGIGGFYYVKTDHEIVECKARGKFRFNELTPMVGDKVTIECKDNKGTINKIHSRTTELIRPAVSNVTQAIVVFAVKNPDINEELLNKFLIFCEVNNLKIKVCFNKLDLGYHAEEEQIIKMIEEAGYDVLFTRAKENIGIDELKSNLKGEISVFCGPSGVGKSTILNKIAGEELMETGEISQKHKRGKHTTRHCELTDIGGGLIVDTPGFSSIDISQINQENLQYCFPEFNEYIGKCKFSSCQHSKEPNCAIKEAVDSEIINRRRYDFYLKILQEIKDRGNKYD
jgi:ribosome biogenesis GTPase